MLYSLWRYRHSRFLPYPKLRPASPVVAVRRPISLSGVRQRACTVLIRQAGSTRATRFMSGVMQLRSRPRPLTQRSSDPAGNGHLVHYPGNGPDRGTMQLTDTTNKVYTASPNSLRADMIFTGDSNITVTADGKTFPGVIRRWNSSCDGCHNVPPAHALQNAGSNGASTCRPARMPCRIRQQDDVSHAYRVPSNEQTTSAGCYRCHPSPCYGGIHAGKFPNDSIGCVTCHGTLARCG